MLFLQIVSYSCQIVPHPCLTRSRTRISSSLGNPCLNSVDISYAAWREFRDREHREYGAIRDKNINFVFVSISKVCDILAKRVFLVSILKFTY